MCNYKIDSYCIINNCSGIVGILDFDNHHHIFQAHTYKKIIKLFMFNYIYRNNINIIYFKIKYYSHLGGFILPV